MGGGGKLYHYMWWEQFRSPFFSCFIICAVVLIFFPSLLLISIDQRTFIFSVLPSLKFHSPPSPSDENGCAYAFKILSLPLCLGY